MRRRVPGGLLRRAFCGQGITRERIRRKLRGGGVREHVYYRCANNQPGEDHPRVRGRATDLEQAIVDDSASLRMPKPDIGVWFRTALEATLTDLPSHQRREQSSLTKRRGELTGMQDRLAAARGNYTFQDLPSSSVSSVPLWFEIS